jgi:hypothetical protein
VVVYWRSGVVSSALTMTSFGGVEPRVLTVVAFYSTRAGRRCRLVPWWHHRHDRRSLYTDEECLVFQWL